MKIRFAVEEDSAALLKIYEQYIDTPITFECSLPSEQAFAGRIAAIGREYPYLVCEEAGQAIGYAYAHRQMEREAYQWNAELSVYLDRSFTAQGIGPKLYCTLMEILRLQGVKMVYGGVTDTNVQSERMHLRLGFHCIGIYRRTGYKCGAWHDVSWFEKEIAPHEAVPEPFVPIGRLPEEQLERLLATHSDAP